MFQTYIQHIFPSKEQIFLKSIATNQGLFVCHAHIASSQVKELRPTDCAMSIRA